MKVYTYVFVGGFFLLVNLAFSQSSASNVNNNLSDGLLSKLSSNDPMIRRQAIVDISMTRDIKYADTIEKYLDDENKLVRMAAIEGLGIIRSQKSAGKILDILSGSKDNDIRNSCIIAISYMPKLDKPLPLINVALNDKDENLRVSAIRTLGSFGIKDIEKEMISIAGDKKLSSNLRVAAVDYLGLIKSEDAKGLIIRLLKDEDKNVRIAAIRAAGDIQIKSAIESLRLISSENQPEVQLEAAFSLAKMQDNSTLDNIYKYLDVDNAFYKNMALNIIGMVGDEKSIDVLNQKIANTKDQSFKSYMEFTREKIKARVKLSKSSSK